MQISELQSKIKKFFEFKKTVNFWKVSTLILTIFLIFSLISNIILLWKIFGNLPASLDSNPLTAQVGSSDSLVVENVSAKEIYPLFECPCCGKSIAQCTCGMAKERKEYVDFLVDTKTSEEEIILAYIKKYGLNSFLDKNKQKEFREQLVATASSDRPIISLSPDSYDFGDVSQKGGKVYTYFELKNEGKNDLVIDRLDTSCGCTFAAIVFKGDESPYFTMPGHGYENSTDWEGVTISPGESAQLKIMYDPDVHKDFRGPAIREISVFSNDPIDFQKNVKIELNQVD